MTDMYDTMVAALREHWKAHDNAYPQRFELTQSTWDALVEQRTLVNKTMNFNQRTALGEDFLGVPMVVSNEGNALVAVDGTRVPLNLS